MPISDEALEAMTDTEFMPWLLKNSVQQAELITTMLAPLTAGADIDRQNHETRMWGIGWRLNIDSNELPKMILITDGRFDGKPFVLAVRKQDFSPIEHIALEPGMRIEVPS